MLENAEIDARLRAAGFLRFGLAGYSAPNWTEQRTLDLGTATKEQLESIGVTLHAPAPGALLTYDAAKLPRGRVMLELVRGKGCRIVLSPSSWLNGYVKVQSEDQLIFIGEGGFGPFHILAIHAIGNESCVVIGARSISNGCRMAAHGEKTYIVLGDDCLLSVGIDIAAADSHAIFDLATLNVLNPAESVLIEPHVWLGANVTLTKGVIIGRGSVIGARSVVTRSIPPRCVAAGVPAKVVREGVSWSVHANPNDADRRSVVDFLDTL